MWALRARYKTSASHIWPAGRMLCTPALWGHLATPGLRTADLGVVHNWRQAIFGLIHIVLVVLPKLKEMKNLYEHWYCFLSLEKGFVWVIVEKNVSRIILVKHLKHIFWILFGLILISEATKIKRRSAKKSKNRCKLKNQEKLPNLLLIRPFK